MKILFDAYHKDEPIPVHRYLNKRKLVKYFSRETAAAIVCVARLLDGESLDPDTPFYYETGIMEYENLGLDKIAMESIDANGGFNQQGFVQQGARAVPPLTQFKALYNMALSFVAIEQGLTGDNGVVYASARALVELALSAPASELILLGSGKMQADGQVECGFVLIDRERLEKLPLPDEGIEGIELLRNWAGCA